jgi:hypothetical protein
MPSALRSSTAPAQCLSNSPLGMCVHTRLPRGWFPEGFATSMSGEKQFGLLRGRPTAGHFRSQSNQSTRKPFSSNTLLWI